jgi:hypothetical protein
MFRNASATTPAGTATSVTPKLGHVTISNSTMPTDRPTPISVITTALTSSRPRSPCTSAGCRP